MQNRIVGLVAVTLVGCHGFAGGGGAGQISGACRGDLGASQAAQKVEVFVNTAAEFAVAAQALQRGLLDACRETGQALAMPPSALGGGDGPEATRAVCQRVNAQLQAELAALRNAGSLQLGVSLVPPACEVRVDAYARCAAECDATFTPGQAELACQGGELRGQCSAQCSGRCAVEVSGACNGICEGSCVGNSVGGRCEGQCQGRCVAEVSGACGGECRGGCSVAFEAPRCTGRVVPPSVNADCRAACDARLDAHAQCTPGRVDLAVQGSVSDDLAPRVARLRAALGGGVATIVQLRQRAERVARSGVALGRAMGELPSAARTVGVQAGLCATAAAAATAQAVASVNISVQVSVEVSGSVEVR